MKIRTKKKGQLGTMWIAIFSLIIASFALVLGLQLLGGFTDTTDNYLGTVTEGAFINKTGYTLLQASSALGYNTPAITGVINGTDGAAIASDKYTLTGNVVKNATALAYDPANITYNYYYGQVAYSSTNKSIVGNATFADYWQLIVLALVIGIIVTLIIAAIAQRRIK